MKRMLAAFYNSIAARKTLIRSERAFCERLNYDLLFNALSREFHADIKIAKDCGSLAVLMSILLAGSVWALAVWSWWITP